MLKTSNDIIAESFQCLNTQFTYHKKITLQFRQKTTGFVKKQTKEDSDVVWCHCAATYLIFSYLHKRVTTITSLHLCWFEVSFDNVSSLLNLVLEKGNALCFLHVYLESNGYEKIALLMILLDAAVTGENKPTLHMLSQGHT